MKFAFCIYKYFPHGGLERDFIRIMSACQQRGHTLDIYTSSWQGVKPKNITIHLVSSSGHSNHVKIKRFVKNLQKQLDRQKYDAVIGFTKIPNLDIFYAADLSYKYRTQNRSFLYKLSPRYRTYSKLEHAVFSPTAKTQILYLSAKVKQQYIASYKTQAERFHLLGPGLTKHNLTEQEQEKIRNQIRKEENIKPDQNILLFIASNFQLKGLDRALLAYNTCCKRLKQKTKLWIIGKDKRIKTYRKLAKKLNILDSIKFFGATDNIHHYILAADLLVHPARLEAAGLAIVESLSLGLPVLTTSVCGYAHHVTTSKAGIVLDEPFNQKKLGLILRLAINHEQLEHWKKNAKKYAQNKELYGRGDAVKIIEQIVNLSQ